MPRQYTAEDQAKYNLDLNKFYGTYGDIGDLSELDKLAIEWGYKDQEDLLDKLGWNTSEAGQYANMYYKPTGNMNSEADMAYKNAVNNYLGSQRAYFQEKDSGWSSASSGDPYNISNHLISSGALKGAYQLTPELLSYMDPSLVQYDPTYGYYSTGPFDYQPERQSYLSGMIEGVSPLLTIAGFASGASSLGNALASSTAAASTAATAGANNMGFWDYLSSGDWGGAWDAASNYFTGNGTSGLTSSLGNSTASEVGNVVESMAANGYSQDTIMNTLMNNYGLTEQAAMTASQVGLEAGMGAADIASALGGSYSLAGGSSGLLSSLGNKVGSSLLSKGISGALGLGGSYLSGRSAQQAAQTSADAQVQAARIAADAAKFRPVGITTNFGSSQFGYDANGNLVSAGYTLTPEMKAQLAKLMGYAGQYLDQYGNVINDTAPMGQAAQTMFNLGNSYLSTSPEEQAKKYYDEQMALVGASDERSLAALNAKLQAQGRGGLAMGGTSTGMMAANPDLEAYYNSQLQRNLQLAANATQGGMDYAKFGAGLVGSGGNMLNSMYTTQSNAYNPYQTALGGATTIEGLGQNALTQGMNMGSTVTAANANAGGLLATGMTNAAKTMQPANAYDPWGSLLSGAGTTIANMTTPQQQYTYDPYTGQKLTSGSTL